MILVNGYLLNTASFPNKENKIFLDGYNIDIIKDNIAKGDWVVKVIWKYEDDSEIWKILLLESYLTNNFPKKLKVVCHIPYMPYSRMDRIEENNHFSLNVLIKSLPKRWNYMLYELHSDMTMKLFNLHVKGFVSESYFTPQLIPMSTWNDCLADRVIILPDKGAYDRYCNVNLPIRKQDIVLYGIKKRDFNTGKIESLDLIYANEPERDLKEILPLKFDVVIIDDLSSYGGTFIRVSEAIRKFGARKINLITGHAEESILKGNLFEHIDKMYTTNSMNNLTRFSNPKLTIMDYGSLLKMVTSKNAPLISIK